MLDIFAAEDAVHLPSCDHLNLVGVREVPQILVVAQVGRQVAPLEALKVVRLELEALKVVQLEALKVVRLEALLEALKAARLGVRKMHSQEGPQGVQMVRQQVRMAAVQSKADLQVQRASLAVIPTSHLQMRPAWGHQKQHRW